MIDRDIRTEIVADVSHLSEYNFGSQGPLWWGMLGLITVELVVFSSLVTSYFYLGLSYADLPPDGIEEPAVVLPTIATLVLLASSVPMHYADDAGTRGKNRRLALFLVISMVLAVAFLVLKYVEYSHVEYSWDSHAYGSTVWAIVIFHSTHVTALLLKTAFVAYLASRDYFSSKRRLGVTINGLYWHFVVIVWLPLYFVIYWAPYLIR